MANNTWHQSIHALRTLFECGGQHRYERGNLLISPYDHDNQGLYIETGFVKVYAPARNGNQNLLCILGQGDVLPLPGLLGIYKVESYYIAMSTVVVRQLPASQILQAVSQDNTISLSIVWQLYDMLMTYSNRVNTLALRTQTERIVSLLLLLEERFGVRHQGMVVLDVPITHQEIAEAIASTRESVSRLLGNLAKQGMVEQRNHMLVIKDHQKLLALLD